MIVVCLPGLEARSLLLEVGRSTGGTHVRWHEVSSVSGGSLTTEEQALMARRVVAGVIRVVLRPVPREDLEEVRQRGDIDPCRA